MDPTIEYIKVLLRQQDKAKKTLPTTWESLLKKFLIG